MPNSIFDCIRRGAAEVAREARDVRIAYDALASYACRTASAIRATVDYDATLHYRGSPEETVAYVVTLDAVNFGSGYFPHLAKRPGKSGYGTIAGALADAFRLRGPLPPGDLSQITAETCARLFEQDLANPIVAELMELFARAWNDLGRDLLERFAGSFTSLVEAADESAERMVELLDREPFFHDVSLYHGRNVPFYKRAQILTSDLARALENVGWGRFHDLDSLTLFADNLVPHVLRRDGVLIYSPQLAERIDRGDLLPSGSPAEVEIRACALHTIERMVEFLRATDQFVAARDLDAALWNRGQSPEYKASPRHRTRTTAY